MYVEDLDGGAVVGIVELRLRWIPTLGVPDGRVQVRLIDPGRVLRSRIWGTRRTPYEEIGLAVDEHVVVLRATRHRRRALEAAEDGVRQRLSALSARLGRKSLRTTKRGPLDIEVEITLRPKILPATQAVLDLLTADERARARLDIWLRVPCLTPLRAEQIVSAADAHLPTPQPHGPHHPSPQRRRSGHPPRS